MLVFLDSFLNIVHTGLILFILLGWIWSRTRDLHLWTTLLTCSSWFLLGIYKGLGYCPLTDWHWDVKRRLGQRELPNSFVKYLVDWLTGDSWEAFTVDLLTATLGIGALGLSVWLQVRNPSND